MIREPSAVPRVGAPTAAAIVALIGAPASLNATLKRLAHVLPLGPNPAELMFFAAAPPSIVYRSFIVGYRTWSGKAAQSFASVGFMRSVRVDLLNERWVRYSCRDRQPRGVASGRAPPGPAITTPLFASTHSP